MYDLYTMQTLQENGIRPFDDLKLPSLEMIKQSVKHGIGFALVPEVSVQRELESGELTQLPLMAVDSLHGLIVRKDRELNYPAKLFKSHLIEFFKAKF